MFMAGFLFGWRAGSGPWLQCIDDFGRDKAMQMDMIVLLMEQWWP
jgi:hypothetical protein